MRETLHHLWNRLRSLGRSREADHDLEEEMAFHLAMRAAKNVKAGVGPEEARYAARRRFGNVSLIREACQDLWTFPSAQIFWQDLHYGLRSLQKARGFAAIAVLAIALGVGVNTGIFSILNGAAMRLLPVPAAGQIVILDQHFHGHLVRNVHGEPTLFSYPEYEEYRANNHVFSGLLAYEPFLQATLGGGKLQQIYGSATSCNYFDALQIAPELGRAFVDADCSAPRSSAAVVLSDNLWRTAFGADPTLIGKSVSLNRTQFTVVGVAPAGFTGTEPIAGSFWVPITMQHAIEPGIDLLGVKNMSWLTLLGRVKPGISLDGVRADLSVIAASLDRQHPGATTSLSVRRATFMGRSEERNLVYGVAVVILAATGLVLLIACANVANLLLARGSTRQKEMALRLSIGASRWRLVRQLLTESLILALLGGTLGSLLASWAFQGISKFVLARLPHDFPTLALNLAPDWHVFAYAFATSLVTGLAFGLLPALRTTRLELNTAMKDGAYGAPSGKRGGLRGTLVGVQVATCMILLLAAGLLMRGLYIAQTVEPGFAMAGITKASLDLRSQGYDAARSATLEQNLFQQIRSVPGVDDAAFAEHTPLDGNHSVTNFSLSGHTGSLDLEFNRVTPDFFSILNIPFVRGRTFSEQESRMGIPVGIVTESTAHQLWGGADPLGQTLQQIGGPKMQIIGIVRDVQLSRLGEATKPYIFLTPDLKEQREIALVLHSNLTRAQIDSAVREVVHKLDPEMPVETAPLTENLEVWRTPSRIVAALSASLGLLALLLASTGIYGVVSYAVSRRAHEIGVRVALGADPRSVLWLLLQQGMRPVLLGVTVGIAGCAAVSWVLSSMLFGLRTYDPLTFCLIPAFLVAIALLACYIPARRALRVDPVIALRYE